MLTKVRKIGNRKGILIPTKVLKLMGIHENDELTIDFDKHSIKLTKKEAFNPQSLDQLFSIFGKSYKSEIIFDDVEGSEI